MLFKRMPSSYFEKSGHGTGRVSRESLASYSSQTASVMTMAILRATSGMERHDLLIATAKLQLFQGQESICGY